MKRLSEKIAEIEGFITQKEFQTVSFDIDGTLYPIRKAEIRWWRKFFLNPFQAMKFLLIRKKWEKRRKGENILVTNEDILFFEKFLVEDLLRVSFVPEEIRTWIEALQQRGLEVYYLSDHGAREKISVFKLQGKLINCLTETGELKPHSKISELLSGTYKLRPQTHLHIGDRWTDEEQARLFGCAFKYLKH